MKFFWLNFQCTLPVSKLCNSLNLTWANARRHVLYREKHQYRFLLHWGFHKDRFGPIVFFFQLHQWFATFYTKFWNWYVCRWHNIWSSGNTCESIQQSSQESLDNANCWFSLNRMKPNPTKTMQMLIRTSQKLRCVDKTCMSLFFNDVKLEEAVGEKLLGIRIDKYLTWNLHIDYVISKLNCKINLLKRSNIVIFLDCRKLLYNSLIKTLLYSMGQLFQGTVGEIVTITETLRQNDTRLVIFRIIR